MSVSVEDMDDHQPDDYRRANGSPMVMVDGKNQRFSRPSGWGKILDDESSLTNWRIDTAIQGIAQSPSLAARVVALKSEDKQAKAKLREDAIQSGRGNEASDMGTALHAMTDRVEDPNDDFNPPEEFQADLDAYLEVRDALGLVSEHIEVKIINVEYRAAGTADRVYRLTKPLVAPDGTTLQPGELVIGDTKTGKSLDFSAPGYTVQLSIYAQGQFYDVKQDCIIDTPEINQRWGIIMHMPAGKARCTAHWVNLDIGNTGAWLVTEVRNWRNAWKAGRDGHDIPVIEVPVPEFNAEEAIVEEMGATPIDAQDEAWLVEMIPFAKARMTAIGAHAEARNKVRLLWPEGVPAPGKIESPEQMTAVLNLLDRIEAEYGLTFPEGDPRVQTSGGHRSETPPVTNHQPTKAPTAKETE